MNTSNFILPGKINMIIDGSFGSTGKGLIASKIASDNHIDIACTTTSPNAGHTFYIGVSKYVTHLIPIAAILHTRSTIIFSAESVINPDLLFKEMKEFNIDPSRVYIHPRAAIIRKEDLLAEQSTKSVISIASTQSGVGVARSNKIMRSGTLAEQYEPLQDMIQNFSLKQLIQEVPDIHILVETGQGLGLDINWGLSYPYCTSRSIMPGTILGELGLHPKYQGNILLSFRTFPIRVGNILDKNGMEIGNSGPFFNDSEEIQFSDIGVADEFTTVTKRKRRVATFSREQYKRAVDLIEPTHVFLNFCNYYPTIEHAIIDLSELRPPDYVGVGPRNEDIYKWEPNILDRLFK